MFDIIGDVHGHAGALVALLRRMGYRETGGAWRRPGRTALFVGDLIDRGPEQVETVRLVRAMIEAGSARLVLGNPEYNALTWATPDPGSPGAFLRPHTAKNRHQHAAFLDQVGEGSPRHEEYLRFFETIPLWLDLPAVRVVHACWHRTMQERLRPHLREGALPRWRLAQVAAEGSATAEAAEVILKGLERPLPAGMTFRDKDGHERGKVRVQWWLGPGTTFREAALIDEAARAGLPDTGLALDPGLDPDDPRPVFFGHYWFRGTSALMGRRAACVDWSVAAGGLLAAYRYDGEQELDARRLVAVTP